MEGTTSVSGQSASALQDDQNQDIEAQWEQSLSSTDPSTQVLNQPNVQAPDGVSNAEMPEEVKKVVGNMIGNMAIEAIKMHNPAKKISMDGDDD